MKLNFTFPRMYEFRYIAIVFLLLLFENPLFAQSVRVYATTISSQSNTDLAPNAVDENLNTRARVRASSGLALGIGAYSGHVEIQYATTLPANTTSYVKIETDDNLLPSLLGGSLGNLLADVAGIALLGNQEFTVQAKNGNSVVLQGDSQDNGDFATTRLKIVANENGDYFVALTPSQPYNRIRFTNRLGSLIGLFNVKNLDIYDAFYISEADNCGYASYTSFSGSGINLDLLNLGQAGVDNPENVLDDNTANFSRLSLGILGVAASIEQSVYFDGLSGSNDQYNIRMRVDPSLLAVGVANNIQLVAWNGPNIVQTASLSSLLNLDLLTLLQGNQVARIAFAPAASDRITVRYSSLLNVQLTQSLDLYDVVRVPKAPIIIDAFTLNAQICSGNTATLIATTAAGYELRWYTAATNGSLLATVSSGQPFITPVLTANTSYYVAAAKIGCTEESRRVKVDVHVTTLPVAADISIPSELTACQGTITLTPTSSIGGASIKYYTDQNKTQEITTGYAGDPGVIYVKDNATGTLAISGLNATDSPYHYFIALTVNGLCENTAGTLKEVTVNFSNTLALQVQNAISGCGSANLGDAILNFDASNTYTFFDATDTPISADAAATITASGTYSIQAQNSNTACLSDKLPVTVTVTTQPNLTITDSAIVTTIGNVVTLSATATGTITWYDSAGNALASNTAGPFAATGIYTYTAIAVNGACSANGIVTVTVLDPADCPPLSARNYADTQSWGSLLTGGVSNASNAVDGDIRSFSTITTGIGLLGIGTTWQTLEWNETIAAGTPVTLKLGSEYSGLTLVGGFSVVGTKRNGSGIPVPIGNLQPVSGSLLDLLPGQNTFEISFVPSNNAGPQAYDGVRIIIGSLVSVAQNAKVFEAYYDIPATQVACESTDAQDVLYGAVDLGIGAVTAAVGVDNPYDAIDASETSYATMFSGLGVLAAAELNVIFRTPSIVGDTLKIRISKPGTLLSASVLAGLSLQTSLNDAEGSLVVSAGISIQLLSGGQEAVISFVPTESFNSARIRLGGVAGVLEFLRVHDVERVANTQIEGADANNAITACQGQTITLEADSIACTTFIWYDAEVGGNIISTGNSYTIPNDLPQGTYTYYIQPVRFGCQFLSRGTVTLTVTETAPEDAIADVTINGAATTSVCAPTGTIVLAATLNATITITNPVYYWYSFDGTTQTLIAGETGPSLTITGLAPGTYTYYLGISSTEYCETAVADRTEITFTILPASVPTDIQIGDAAVCLDTDAVLTPSSTLSNPVFTYYFTNDTTQPITNGLVVGGVTYTTAANGTLTITGLAESGSPYTYYVAVTSDTTCINLAGNLEPVSVTVGSLLPPTTTNTTQNFCQANNPTVADIQINETNVVFYDAPVGGSLIASTTPLVAGTYYAALVDGICESEIRLAITVTIGTPGIPTTDDPTQNFCLADNPTVANIQVNETNVVFYDAPVGGNLITATTPLVAGIYYAAILDGLCESDTRLAITVTISNPATPTTTNETQDFCQGDAPTVSDIQVNEPNVVFYTAPTGGTALAGTDALVSGMYYASLVEAGTNCESSVRLEIAVTVTTVGTPTTTDATQDFCQADNPTIADIEVNETGVIFYDAPTGGNSLAAALPLASGMYYAVIANGICESDIRLAITVTVIDPETPTTTNTAQVFCFTDNPTVADLQVNETDVVFYTMPTGGSPLDLATALTAGTYYAALVEGNCESGIRLVIAVTISNPGTPTTTDDTQTFCFGANPTVANIQVNEPNVVFYLTPTGGAPLATTTALVSGIYYAALVEGACESIVRLQITVQISGLDTAEITGGDESCHSESVTYSTMAGMTNYIWTVTGGIITAGGTTADNTVTVEWNTIGTGNVSVAFTDANCGSLSTASRNITIIVCSDITITKTVDNPSPGIGDTVMFTITITNNGQTQFTNIVVNEQLPNGFKFVSATATSGTYSETSGIWTIPVLAPGASVTLQIMVLILDNGNYVNTASIVSSEPIDSEVGNNSATASVDPICLIVYNEFSPNGDGDNDLFRIDCIESYPNNTLQVHNRYGVAVYKTRGYHNQWDGTANVNSPINEDNQLPSGTYYYILELGDGNGTKSGWLYIIR